MTTSMSASTGSVWFRSALLLSLFSLLYSFSFAQDTTRKAPPDTTKKAAPKDTIVQKVYNAAVLKKDTTTPAGRQATAAAAKDSAAKARDTAPKKVAAIGDTSALDTSGHKIRVSGTVTLGSGTSSPAGS